MPPSTATAKHSHRSYGLNGDNEISIHPFMKNHEAFRNINFDFQKSTPWSMVAKRSSLHWVCPG